MAPVQVLLFITTHLSALPYDRRRMFLCIGIGSANGHTRLRESIRRTWASNLDFDVTYRFFADAEGVGVELNSDVVLRNGTIGYNTNNAERELFAMRYFVDNYECDYYLRTDDDGYLCLHNVLFYLRQRIMAKPLIYGRFHCNPNLARPDENFLLFDSQMVRYLHYGYATQSLPFISTQTIALNIGYLVSLLETTVEIIDDQNRLWWPSDNVPQRPFELRDAPHLCQRFLWAHWVKTPRTMQSIHRSRMKLPGGVQSTVSGCRWHRSKFPRYSQRLYSDEIIANVSHLWHKVLGARSTVQL